MSSIIVPMIYAETSFCKQERGREGVREGVTRRVFSGDRKKEREKERNTNNKKKRRARRRESENERERERKREKKTKNTIRKA